MYDSDAYKHPPSALSDQILVNGQVEWHLQEED